MNADERRSAWIGVHRRFRVNQKLMRRPKRNCRSSGLAPVIDMKSPEERSDPSGLKVMFDAFAPGLLKCGVLVMLAASARNSISVFSDNWNFRNRPASKLPKPGPRRVFRPLLPKRTAVT